MKETYPITKFCFLFEMLIKTNAKLLFLVCVANFVSMCSASLLEDYLFIPESIRDNREITLELNPSCNIPLCATSNNNIAYARLQGEFDCLHYLFSAGGGIPPTLLMIKSNDTSSYAKIMWDKFLNDDVSDFAGSVNLVTEEENTQSVNVTWQNTLIINKILEYNDTRGDADFNDPANVFFSPIPLSNLTWDVTISNTSVFIKGTSLNSTSFSTNSSVILEFVTYDKSGRNKTPPKLPHTCNSTDINIVFDSLNTRGSASRFVIEMIMIGNVSADLQTSVKKSIDDEYSPTVFEVDSLWWKPRQESSTPKVFYEWRKVCYKSQDRSVKFSSDTAINNATDTSTEQPDISENKLVRGYYNNTLFTDEQGKTVVVTFGRSDDFLYNTTKYLAWTVTIGFGKPPADPFSLLVIIMLLAAVGIPLIVIILGGVFTVGRKCSRRNGYTKLSGSIQNPTT